LFHIRKVPKGQKPSGFKAIIKSIFKTNLPSLTDSFALPFFLRKLLKFTKSCKNASKNEIYLQEIYQSSNQEMFAISLSSCSRYNANFKLDQSVSAIHDSPPYFWDQWGWPPTQHPNSVGEPRRDHWWTLDFANAFASPGVNSLGELIPSHGASRRRLGD
jgi:hypothetical protein